MRTMISLIGLQAYALLLAWFQSLQFVRTDEAKYLLNIPYPHPPLARGLLGFTDGWAYQEIFWRVAFATAMVQAVWIVWNMGKGLCKSERILLALCWLLAGGVILQAGTILMAPLTALQILLFTWLYLRDDVRLPAGLLGLLWLGSLFTAFQAVLFAPLAWTVVMRATPSRRMRFLCFAVPLALLALYALSNPLALASMVIHTEREGVGILSRFFTTVHLWLIGGSIALAILGTWGLLKSRKWPMICTFLLVFAYVVVGPHHYYAVLFVPPMVAGALYLMHAQATIRHGLWLIIGGAAWVLWLSVPLPTPTAARATMRLLREREVRGIVLINGSFGHEWQYESSLPIERYRADALDDASAVVCLESCAGMSARPKWAPLSEAPVESWVKVID